MHWESSPTTITLLCVSASNSTEAFLLCLGISVCDEVIFSTSLSRSTTTDKPRYEALKLDLEFKYLGGKKGDETTLIPNVSGELENVIRGINISTADRCIECDGMVRGQRTPV